MIDSAFFLSEHLIFWQSSSNVRLVLPTFNVPVGRMHADSGYDSAVETAMLGAVHSKKRHSFDEQVRNVHGVFLFSYFVHGITGCQRQISSSTIKSTPSGD